MTGQPIKQQMLATLAAQLPDPDPSLSTEEQAEAYTLAYMENGGRLSQLATSIGVSRWLIDRWIKGTPERHARFSHARVVGADALVDEGGDLLDAATRDTIAVANARAGWRKWLAGKYDPLTYGEGTQGTIVLGDLHLHALQGRRADQQLAPPPSIPQSPPLQRVLPTGEEAGYPTEPSPAVSVEIHTKE